MTVSSAGTFNVALRAFDSCAATSSGSAPNRVFTVEWFDFAFSVGGAPGVERLRFQAKLFETSNVVELHDCALLANGGSADLVSGASATVGLENAAGTDAVRHSFNTPGSVVSGGALRFTPQP
ncbi:MAG: hypothetical protein AB1938_21420 [Myxococcota bacterium]